MISARFSRAALSRSPSAAPPFELRAHGAFPYSPIAAVFPNALEPTVTISRLPYSASFIVVCVLVAGCKPKTKEIPDATPAPVDIEGTPVSDAECKAFARRMEQAASKKNRALLEKLISLQEIALRCIGDLSMTGNQRQSVIQGTMAGMQKEGLAAQLVAGIERGGSLSLLRVHEVNGRPRALLRLLGSDAGVSYLDLVLSRSPEGRISVEDIYIFTSGEMLTQSMRRILLPAVAKLNKASVANLPDTDRTFLDNMPKFLAMGEAIQAGNKAEAVKIYKALPVEFREQKVIVFLYLSAADGDDVEYVAALELYRKLFPADPALDLLSIDYFRLKKQYDDALGSIDKIEQAIGGDPYLHVMRANLLIEANRYIEARASAEKAIEQEPTLSAAYWSRIIVSVKEKNHLDTLLWLKKLVGKTSEEVADLTKVVEYSEFVKSPQHAEWLKWYAGKK